MHPASTTTFRLTDPVVPDLLSTPTNHGDIIMDHDIDLYHLVLALRDLLNKRHPDLLKSKAGQYYDAQLKNQLVHFDLLPPTLTGTPFAGSLREEDKGHDGYGGVIFFTTEQVRRNPDATKEQVAAAGRIRAGFIPMRSELRAEYAVEAHRADEHEPLLTTLKTDLESLKTATGGTLYEVAQKFVASGHRINKWLSERADVEKAARKEAAVVRSETVGILGRLRADLVKEVNSDASLPRDLEHRVFGYFDQLAPNRQHVEPETSVSPANPIAPVPATPPAPVPATPAPAVPTKTNT